MKREIHDKRSINPTRIETIIKIRASVLKYIRNWLDKNGYLEIPTPIIVNDPIETELSFKLDYFGRDAFISHNNQLYLEKTALSVGNAWTINPSFRAEKGETTRHLSEFLLLQIEKINVANLNGLLQIQEDLISQLIENIVREREDSFNSLETNFQYLKNIKPHFDIVRYDDVIETLRSKGFKVNKNGMKRDIEWGDDLDVNAETELTRDRLEPIFVTHYPMKLKPFYIEHDRVREDTSLSVDLLAPKGFGEITSGGMREDDIGILKEELKFRYLDENKFQWYCDEKKKAFEPHGGFGMGIDRLVRWLTNTQNIKDVLPFPRTPSILEP